MSLHLGRPNCESSLGSIELQPRINTINLPTISPSTSEPARQETVHTGNELLPEVTAVNLENTVVQLQRWNNPRSNIPRTFTTFLSFAIMGATDAAYGVRLYAQIPSLKLEYHI